jgi:pyrimidine operon attenuation protein/uracil phosphoribosyltransferase
LVWARGPYGKERSVIQPTVDRKVQVLGPDDVSRALSRIAHEIIERNRGVEGVAVVGLQAGGVPLARRVAAALEEISSESVALGQLDVVWYRDDLRLRPVHPAAPTTMPFDVTGRTVVLVDDVIFTGRTVRAALAALADLGRPRAVQLAVLVDRGHRELPIRPDYVGKNLPTRRSETVIVGEDGVWLSEARA